MSCMIYIRTDRKNGRCIETTQIQYNLVLALL